MDAATNTSHEHELAELRRRFAEAEAGWARERAALVRERDELAQAKAHLLAQLSKHVRARFGAISEKLSLEQMTLFSKILEREVEAAVSQTSTLDEPDGSIAV